MQMQDYLFSDVTAGRGWGWWWGGLIVKLRRLGEWRKREKPEGEREKVCPMHDLAHGLTHWLRLWLLTDLGLILSPAKWQKEKDSEFNVQNFTWHTRRQLIGSHISFFSHLFSLFFSSSYFTVYRECILHDMKFLTYRINCRSPSDLSKIFNRQKKMLKKKKRKTVEENHFSIYKKLEKGYKKKRKKRRKRTN